jgi:hypothetical protein
MVGNSDFSGAGSAGFGPTPASTERSSAATIALAATRAELTSAGHIRVVPGATARIPGASSTGQRVCRKRATARVGRVFERSTASFDCAAPPAVSSEFCGSVHGEGTRWTCEAL